MSRPKVPPPEIGVCSPSYVSGLVRSGLIRPRRRLGQNFLVDRNVLGRVAAALGELEGATVLEIGAGLGSLTFALAAAGAARVVAVEKDRTLAGLLTESVAGRAETAARSPGAVPGGSRIEVVTGDALEIDLRRLTVADADGEAGTIGPDGESGGESGLRAPSAGKVLVAGNLPYSVTTPLLLRLIEPPLFWSRAVVMVQLEVAERLLAGPGGKDYGALTLAVAAVAEARLAFKVSRHSFYPRPEVDSAVLRLERRATPAGGLDAAGLGRLSEVVRAAFGQRRKTLANALAAGLGLERQAASSLIAAAGIDPGRRGETLSLEEFVALERAFRHLPGRCG